MMQYKKFNEIDLDDVFFDSLKNDYPGFDDWFKKKADEMACVLYEDEKLQAFLYTKDERTESLEKEEDVIKNNVDQNRLKVGTFKIEAAGTTRGERFIKKIVDEGIAGSYKNIYMTIFPKHKHLIKLVETYGFELKGYKKNEEGVYVKDISRLRDDKDQNFNFPLLSIKDKKKYILSIYPIFHTRLFPDSILKNEESYKYNLVKDVSVTNTIHKIYICFMNDTKILKKGDIVCIYRTSDNLGPAYYRSVVTSICQVEEVKTKANFVDIDDYLQFTKKSIFNEKDRADWYRKRDVIVIKMTYNIALTNKLTRGYMIDNLGISSSSYWGFMEITDKQFDGIIKKGEIYENIIVD